MQQSDLFLRFGIATAIGFLIGAQREFAHGGESKEIFAGERTLALMGLLGCGAALASDAMGSAWAFLIFILAVAILTGIAYFIAATKGDVGITTEVAALIVVLAGAMVYWGYFALAVAIGVTTTVILSLKLETDLFIRRITREDVYATLKFAVISAIVLPVLPNIGLGRPPFDVLNPYKIWLMVVFISGISFLGYLSIKIVGSREGIGLTGFLGGLASSTAVTLSFAQRSQRQSGLAKPFALAIVIAWTMMFTRVLVEVAAINRALLQVVWLPLVAAGAVALLYCVYLYFSQKPDDDGDVELANPFELGPAIKFGLLYAGVLLISRAAQMYLGDTGIYASSLLSGLADVDAITLSMAQLSLGPSGIALDTASLAVVLAAMSNTLVKGGIVLAMGSKSLRMAILPGFVLILLTGLLVAFIV